MKDILPEQGIAPCLGAETLEDAKQDIEALRQELEASASKKCEEVIKIC